MRGEIISHDDVMGTGLISGDDGLRYEFAIADIQSGEAAVGLRADFAAEAGRATQIMVLAATPQPTAVNATAAAPNTIDWQHLMLQFNGRTRRSHFGIAWLILFAVSFVLGLIPFIGGLISLVLIWPNLAIAVKRLHDMGKTGWLAAIPYVACLVGGVIAFGLVGASVFANPEAFQNEDPAAVMAAVGPALGIFGIVVLIGLGFLLWIGLTPGQPGPNRFGPNPKGE